MWPGAIYPTQRKYPLWIIPFGSDSFGHSLGLLLSPCLVFFYFSFLHINQLKSDSQNHHMVDNNWHAHLTLEKEVDKSCHSLTKSSPLWTVTGRIYSLVLFLCTRSEMIAIFFFEKKWLLSLIALYIILMLGLFMWGLWRQCQIFSLFLSRVTHTVVFALGVGLFNWQSELIQTPCP